MSGVFPLRVWTIVPAAALCAALLGFAAPAAPAQDFAVPRWVSLRADEVNVRVGPGTDYPVRWVYVRAGLPVEVTADFHNWRRIRDIDGEEGWVHRSLLSGARTVIVTGGVRTLRRTPDAYAAPVLRAESGVIADLLECDGAWCRLEIDGERGWLPRIQVWGVYADETLE
ncbi:MAG: SH3 domain-containing protein [Proteobacteria bacterium]|nr:SH3 domain-containing protein [Pseudomonadota bacterium]MDA1131850.1 SH3 domain-containing protein [Pseudomonadota bacterium]